MIRAMIFELDSTLVKTERLKAFSYARVAFDFVASRDDVEHGKPDLEMYLMVADQLGVSPEECLINNLD